MEWDAPQKEIYTAATKKAQALSDTIINSRLSKKELESIAFIIQLEILKRKEQREQKKILNMEKYKAAHQGETESEE